MRVSQQQLFSAVNAGINETSGPCDVSQLSSFSLQSISTGTATGTIQVQVSNDPPANGDPGITPSNWTNLAGATIAVTAASTLLLPRTASCYNWLRLTFTTSAGAGFLTANLVAHEI